MLVEAAIPLRRTTFNLDRGDHAGAVRARGLLASADAAAEAVSVAAVAAAAAEDIADDTDGL